MKKLVFGLIVLAVTAVGIYSGVRLNARAKRQAAYKEALNKKAEQISWRSIEGWTNGEIAADLDQKGIVSKTDFNAALAAEAQTFDYFGETPRKKSLEGYLFPDTYYLAKGASAKGIIEKILANTKSKITPDIIAEIHAQGKTVYDTLTLASIVEREVGRNTATISSQDQSTLQNEREIVAGIFMNRLKIGMPLQSDATVNYITGSKNPSVSIQDTKINSPYNTYKYAGLPPGPIGNPSLNSILAVVHYRVTDYLYFLNKPDGTAVYAKTLDEHNANKAKYLK